ncbi:MAG: Holliday junction resolvase RecU, partial [Lachnospiraceae bacterium]|nr:Holliday junction resolvase RecU [Lachnospiraceae bacterium]
LNKKTNKLEGAFFLKKSTVDYIGVVQEIPVCFDAKETRQDKFSLDNVKAHQLSFMKDFEKQGGVSFLLIYFVEHDEVIYVRYSDIEKYIKICKKEKRKYITYDELDKDFSIDVKNKLTFPFLKKLEMDLDRR